MYSHPHYLAFLREETAANGIWEQSTAQAVHSDQIAGFFVKHDRGSTGIMLCCWNRWSAHVVTMWMHGTFRQEGKERKVLKRGPQQSTWQDGSSDPPDLPFRLDRPG